MLIVWTGVRLEMIGHFVHLLLSRHCPIPLLLSSNEACHDSNVSAVVAVVPHLVFDDSGPSSVDVSVRSRFLWSAPISNVRMALRQARNRYFVPPQRVAILADAADVPCSSQPSLIPGVRTPYFDEGQCGTTSASVSYHPSTSQSPLILTCEPLFDKPVVGNTFTSIYRLLLWEKMKDRRDCHDLELRFFPFSFLELLYICSSTSPRRKTPQMSICEVICALTTQESVPTSDSSSHSSGSRRSSSLSIFRSSQQCDHAFFNQLHLP